MSNLRLYVYFFRQTSQFLSLEDFFSPHMCCAADSRSTYKKLKVLQLSHGNDCVGKWLPLTDVFFLVVFVCLFNWDKIILQVKERIAEKKVLIS